MQIGYPPFASTRIEAAEGHREDRETGNLDYQRSTVLRANQDDNSKKNAGWTKLDQGSLDQQHGNNNAEIYFCSACSRLIGSGSRDGLSTRLGSIRLRTAAGKTHFEGTFTFDHHRRWG